MVMRLPAGLACVLLACSGSHTTVPDPPLAVIVGLDHEEASRDDHHSGHSSIDAFGIYAFNPERDRWIKDGPCSRTETTPAEVDPWDWQRVDVGKIDILTPTGTDEWNDGETLDVRGAGNATFPAWEHSFRAASKIVVTSPTSANGRTKIARGRDLVVTWSSKDLEQDAFVQLIVSDWVDGDWQHLRGARCRGNGGTLVVPASIVDFITVTPWTPTKRKWFVIAERIETIETARGPVHFRSHTPFIDANLDNWTSIDVE